MNKERLIKKLQKLLAMANDKGSEHEAAIALKQLHSLLAKHNLSMGDIQEEEDKVVSSEGVKDHISPWKRVVANKIAELYFCKLYVSKVGPRHHMYMFVGTDANRTFAKHIFQLAVKVIEKEARDQSRLTYGKIDSPFLRSFWSAAANRVSERCAELIELSKRGELVDESGNTLPALVSTYEINLNNAQDWIDENLTIRKINNRLNNSDANGANAGRKTGDKVQLSRELQSNSGPKLLN